MCIYCYVINLFPNFASRVSPWASPCFTCQHSFLFTISISVLIPVGSPAIDPIAMASLTLLGSHSGKEDGSNSNILIIFLPGSLNVLGSLEIWDPLPTCSICTPGCCNIRPTGYKTYVTSTRQHKTYLP